MTPGPRIRRVIKDLPVYRAGRRPAADAGIRTFKASSNENPNPPLPQVVAAITAALTDIHRYPDPSALRMTAALAQRFGVTPEEVSCGTGSVGVLSHLMQAMVDAGDEVIHAWRSFEAYPIVIALAGGVSIAVPLRDERHDLDAMARAITERTKVVFVCSPNNPTGTAVHTAEFDRFMAQVPQSVLVVVDEAYAEFINDDSVLNGLDAYRRYPNVAVLRSFSKSYGLAGLRVGMCIASPEVTAALRKASVPFGVSDLAQVAVLASLEYERALLERVSAIGAQRERVVSAVRDLGFTIAEQQANFIWIRIDRAAELAQACERAGVTIRPFTEGDPQGAGVRITIGDVQADAVILEVLKEFAPSR
jgi:histidinol-phosphate aminotransferase